jgi:hypothetical protein
MSRDVTISLLACLVLLSATVGCASVSSSEAAETTEIVGTDLTATIEAPPTLTTGETMPLRFTLTNNADTKLYVLKWYTPLEGVAGKIFRVRRDGEVLPYGGIMATRAAPSADSYVLLEPGASASAEVDLAPAYDFSQAGTYTIEFLSPKISHVARSEAEMATSLDGLGPVEMPSNAVTVEIDSSGVSNDRLRPEEAEELVRDYLHSEKPNLGKDFALPMEELPAPEVWAHLPVQIFRVTDGPFAQETFLADDGTVVKLGSAAGGQGVTSLRVSDLDGDGTAELLFTYSFGSGIHQSRIGMYAPAYAEDRVYEAEMVYLGDVGLVKEDMSHMVVRVVESDEESRVLRYGEALGHLMIQTQEDEARLVLQVGEELPDDVQENLTQATEGSDEEAYRGWEMYVNAPYGFAFRYPLTWTLEEEANLVKLSQGTLLLAISFRRQDEDVPPPWSGMPAGNRENQGTMSFLGQEIEKTAFVYEGRVKLLTYDAQVGDLMFSIRLDDAVTADYAAIDIPETAQSEVDGIVASFESQ